MKIHRLSFGSLTRSPISKAKALQTASFPVAISGFFLAKSPEGNFALQTDPGEQNYTRKFNQRSIFQRFKTFKQGNKSISHKCEKSLCEQASFKKADLSSALA